MKEFFNEIRFFLTKMANSFIDKSNSAVKIGEFLGHEDEIRVIIFSQDCSFVYSGGWDNKILRWKLPKSDHIKEDTNRHIHTAESFIGHNGSITNLYLTNDGQFLFSSSKDGTIKVWNTINKKCIRSFNQNGKIYALCLDKSEKNLIAAGENCLIKFYRIERNMHKNREKRDIEIIEAHHTSMKTSSSIHVLKINEEGDLLASSGDENLIYLWSFPEGKFKNCLTGHNKFVYSIDFHPTLPILASGGKEKSLYLWNLKKNSILKRIKVPASISHLRFSQDGNLLLTSDFKNNVRILDWKNGGSLQKIHFDKGKKLTIGLSDDWELFGMVPFATRPMKIYLWSFDY